MSISRAVNTVASAVGNGTILSESSASFLPGTLDWTSDASVIVAEISGRPLGIAPFTYCAGAKIEILEAEVSSFHASPTDSESGTVVAIDDSGAFIVTTGSGSVRVTSYDISFYVHKSTDLAAVMRTFGLNLPQKLSRIPFLDNRSSTVWERGVRAWGLPTQPPLDEIQYIPGSAHPSMNLIEPNHPYFRWLFSRLGIGVGSRSLDIGCADGWALSIFAGMGHHVDGFDVAPASLAIAKRHIPAVRLAELDYNDAGDHYARIGAEFDFVFCRGLGVAQKIVDWKEVPWIAATHRLANVLSPTGVMYWSQYGSRTGTIDGNGMSSASVTTVLEYFRNAGLRVLSLSVFHSIFAVLLVRPEFPEERIRIFRELVARERAVALRRYRDAADRGSIDGEITANAFRAAAGHLSDIFLGPGLDDNRPLYVAGSGAVADLYRKVASLLRLPVLSAWPDPSEADDTASSVGSTYPAAVVIADPRQRASVARRLARQMAPPIVLDPWLPRTGSSVQVNPIYLISGDQDTNLLPVIERIMAPLATSQTST